MDRLLNYDYLSRTAIVSLKKRIDDYNRDWKQRERLDADRLRTLRTLATINSVGSSTRIEGASLSDEEVAKLIKNMDITKLVSRDEQEVAGYYTVLDIIQDGYQDFELTESFIKGLHNELMRHSEKDCHHRGDYKQHSNQVVATDEAGNTRTIFNTTDVFQTGDAMRLAVAWYHEQKDSDLHPLERVFAFVYEFLSIHPFQDGNGRLSRLLTTLLLLQNGYEFVLYYSMEQGIEDRKKDYYKTLMLAQRYRGTEREEIGRFMHFMLKTLHAITGHLDNNEATVVKEPQAIWLNRRMRDVLDFIADEGELSISQIDALLPVVSRSTIKNDLAKLTESGYLVRHGKGRGTVYTRN